jgi:anti-sigma factor RsiW
MSCETYRAWLDDHLDDTLDNERRRAVERHLAVCAECSALAEDLRRVRDAARALGPAEPPAELWKRIEGAVARSGPARSRVEAPPWGQWLAAAAALALVAGGLWWTGQRLRQPGPDGLVTALDVAAEFEAAQAAYEAAIDDLELVADPAASSPVAEPAWAELRAGLSDLDAVIVETQATLAEQPSDTFSQEQLLSALSDKVAILQETAFQDTVARLDIADPSRDANP